MDATTVNVALQTPVFLPPAPPLPYMVCREVKDLQGMGSYACSVHVAAACCWNCMQSAPLLMCMRNC